MRRSVAHVSQNKGREMLMKSSVFANNMAQTTSSTWPLLALAMGTFAIGTSEFMPMGLLPVIARGVGVSIPSVGLLVSAYAMGVLVGVPLMTLAVGHVRRRKALLVLMALFIVGNVMSSLAPGYGTLVIGRLVTSLSHGAFFGLGAVVAASVVPEDRQARAMAAMFSGLTIANIGGVPAATWLGEQVGWRMAFAGATALGTLAFAALAFALPRGEDGKAPNLRQELRILARPNVLLAMATTAMSAGAMFTLYTYIAPVLSRLTGASDAFITFVLLMIGVGFTIGMGVGGRLADWSLDGSIVLSLAAVGLIMVALPWILPSHWGAAVGLTAWGAATFALVPALQVRVMRAAAEAPGLASSINIGAFNLGNAIGAAVGGAVISLHLGFHTIPIAGGALALIGLAIALMGRIGARAS
jgi:DHA1 family inner membrane transport protein